MRYYRTKVVERVVDQLSPCFRLAAQGRCSHSSGPFSSPGRLCHGSMQIKCSGFLAADQISVYGKSDTSQMTLRPVSFSTTETCALRRLTMQWLSLSNKSSVREIASVLRAR